MPSAMRGGVSTIIKTVSVRANQVSSGQLASSGSLLVSKVLDDKSSQGLEGSSGLLGGKRIDAGEEPCKGKWGQSMLRRR